jgi:hypothetical protein
MSDGDEIEIDIGPAKICLTCVSFLHAEGQAAMRAHLRRPGRNRSKPDLLDRMKPAERAKLGLCAEERSRLCMPLGTCEKWSAR